MPITVAIVDDHRFFREALIDLVRDIDGFQLLYVAANGHELFELIQGGNQAPDLALVDLHMPVLDGFETTRQLRHLYPAVRVLILTISNLKEDIIKAVGVGAQGYLVKDASAAHYRQAMDDLLIKGTSFPDFFSEV